VQIVRAYLSHGDQDALIVDLGAEAATIAQIVTEVRDRLPNLPTPPELEPEQARFRFFDSLARWMHRASRRQPLVLILDDLHWADTPSLLLLQFFAHEVHNARVFIIGAYRDTDVDREHPLSTTLGVLARESQRLVLSGFVEEEVAHFIQETTGVVPSPKFVSFVYEQTEGNPFFLSELVRLLDAEGQLSPSTNTDAIKQERIPQGRIPQGRIPQGVRDLIRLRLKHLSPLGMPVLTAAAVIGREFTLELLTQACRTWTGMTWDTLLSSIQEATAARILSEAAGDDRRYRFVHALIRETLYEDTPLPDRVQLHRYVGEAIETLYGAYLRPYLPALADHFFKAAVSGVNEKALEYAIQAGERANALLAYEDAVTFHERALQLLPARPDTEVKRCELLLALGSAQAKAGENKKSRATFLQAAGIGRTLHVQDASREAATYLARAALGLMVRSDSVTRFDQVLLDLLEEARQALPDAETRLRARVCGALAVALYFSPAHERRAVLSQQAVELARDLGETATLASALYAKHFATWGPDNLEERLATATELVHLAEAAGTKEIAIGGHFWRLLDLLEYGDADGFAVEFQTYLRLADELRQPTYLWRATVLRAMRALFEGRFEEGGQLAQEAFTRGQHAQTPNAFLVFAVQLFGLRQEQGRLQELEEALKGFVERYPAIPAFRAGLAFLHAELGQREEARSEFEQLAAANFTGLPRDGNWLNMVDELARVCAFLGDAQRAAQLYDMLRPYATRNIVISFADGCNGAVACYLGILATVLARWPEAEEHFRAAVRMNQRFQARPFIAHTQYEYARMLLMRDQPGDHEQAGQLLHQALSIAQELGMKNLEEKIQGLGARGWGLEEESQKSKVKSQKSKIAPPQAPSLEFSTPSPQHPIPNTFRQDGEYWTVSYAGTVSRLRPTKGFPHLVCLLREPGREFHVLDLLAMTDRETPAPRGVHNTEATTSALLPDVAPVPDPQARASYRQRLQSLRIELTEAEQGNDLGRITTLRTEEHFLTKELSVAYGIGQHARTSSGEIEKARKAVAYRIRAALEKIKKANPALWRHLFITVKTGVFCSYNPEKPTIWQL
jgi:tetratricopeptide (TPR) repeat protein